VKNVFVYLLITLFIATPALGGSLSESVFGNPLPAGPSLELDGKGTPQVPSGGSEYGSMSRSAFKEAAWSLIVPGLAQYRLGHEVRSSFYFAVEGITLLAIGGFLWQGYSDEKAYKDYAVAFAGISGTDHPDDYYEKMGRYMSSDGPGGYNEYILREARDLYYPDLDAIDQYYTSNMIAADQSWQWRTVESFQRYGDLRDNSRAGYRRALYSVVFAISMRVVSTIDAVRLARSDASGEKSTVSIGIEQRGNGIALSMSRSF
jgi:hypothetical protein